MNLIKTAFFGACHPHGAMLYGELKRCDRFQLLGYADVPEYDGLPSEERFQNLGVGAKEMTRFDDWHELLRLNPDLAVVICDNMSKTDICLEMLSRGINVLVEKPMAISFSDALKMKECAQKHGVKVITNWPISWFSTFRKAMELAHAGEVGEIRRVVYRSPATWGPYSYSPDGSMPDEDYLKRSWWYQKRFGGGSILDYACYGALLSTWAFDKEVTSVKAFAKQFDIPFSDVEDYSAMLLDFGCGVGLLEGSWSSYNPAEIPTGPIIYGSKGVIVCDRHSNDVKIYTKVTHKPQAPDKVITLDSPRTADTLKDHLLAYFDKTGELHKTIDMDVNVSVMKALTLGALSAEESK